MARLAHILVLALVPAWQDGRVPPPGTGPLAEALRGASGEVDEAFLREAKRAGPALFGFLRAAALPALEGDEEPSALSADQRSWILAGVRALGRREAAGLARDALARDHEAGTRVAALAILGAVGEGHDLRELLAWALPEGTNTLEPGVNEALRDAAGEILARDERAFDELARWRSFREPLLEPLLRAAGEAPGPRALEFLTEVIHWNAAHAPAALSEVQELGRSFDPATDQEARLRIRPLLDPLRPELGRAAALALGALGDIEAVPELAALLEEGPGLRANAHWALRRITGLAIPPEREAWDGWFGAELAWFEREGEAALAQLAAGGPSELAAAFHALAPHLLAREELVQTLLERVWDDDPAVRILAIRALGSHGDRRAIPELGQLRDAPEVELAAAAREALQRLSGRRTLAESGSKLSRDQ